MEYRSIKEIIDTFYPDMEYRNASGGNLRLSRCPFCGGKKAYINPKPSVNGFFVTVENVVSNLDLCHCIENCLVKWTPSIQMWLPL